MPNTKLYVKNAWSREFICARIGTHWRVPTAASGTRSALFLAYDFPKHTAFAVRRHTSRRSEFLAASRHMVPRRREWSYGILSAVDVVNGMTRHSHMRLVPDSLSRAKNVPNMTARPGTGHMPVTNTDPASAFNASGRGAYAYK